MNNQNRDDEFYIEPISDLEAKRKVLFSDLYNQLTSDYNKNQQEGRRDIISRLVWIIAISGYIILNINNFYYETFNMNLIPKCLLFLVAPWSISAFMGILAHWVHHPLSRNIDKSDYIVRLTIMESRNQLANISDDQRNEAELEFTKNAFREDGDIKKTERNTNKLGKIFNFTYYSTLSFFLLGIIITAYVFIFTAVTN